MFGAIAGGIASALSVVAMSKLLGVFLFFFNDTATTEIYTLSLHDALPICLLTASAIGYYGPSEVEGLREDRSEEHTSELQSRPHLVCRLLLEKKKKLQ